MSILHTEKSVNVEETYTYKYAHTSWYMECKKNLRSL